MRTYLHGSFALIKTTVVGDVEDVEFVGHQLSTIELAGVPNMIFIPLYQICELGISMASR